MLYVSSNEVKTEVKTHWSAVLPVPHNHTLHFIKPINDEKLKVCETSSGDSFTVVIIFKITNQEAKEVKAMMKVKLSEKAYLKQNFQECLSIMTM